MTRAFLLQPSHPVVRDHRVFDQHLLPGLAYIDLMYQFMRAEAGSPLGFELRDLTIAHPLVLAQGRDLRCELQATRDEAGDWSVLVQGRDHRANGSGGEATRYATANMRPTSRPEFDETIDPDAIARAAVTVADVEEFYARCRAHQLMHAGFMKAEGTAYLTVSEALVDLRLGPEAAAQADRLLFHPTLLDAAAICAVMAAGRDEDLDTEGLALPLYARAFRASGFLRHRCFVRVRALSVQRLGEVRYVDVDFFDETGRKIAELEHLGSKLVRSSETLGATATPVAHVPAAQAAARPSVTPAPGLASDSRHLSVQVEEFLRRLIAEQAHCALEAVSVRRGYYELGLTSVALLDLVRRLERAAGVSLTPTLLFEYTTIAELAAHLAETNAAACHRLIAHAAGQRDEAAPAMTTPAATPRSAAVHVTRDDTALEAENGDIAVIALAGRFPQAADVTQFWHNLRDGKDGITEVPAARWPADRYFDVEKGRAGATCTKWGGFLDGIDEFDPLFFNMSPREAALIDPQQRLLLETVWTLLESAGYTRRRLREAHRSSVGVYVGVMYQHYSALESSLANEAMTAVSSFGAIANRVSYFFGLNGPSLAVDTMCSSSATALHLASTDLRQRACQLAIVGGVNLSLHPKKYVGLSQLRLTGSDPERRSFADGDGFQPAEAVAAVLLKPLARALADRDPIRAVIKGTATNHGGRSQGFAMPSRPAQREVIEQALGAANVEARTISYVEAAANGAGLVDAVEFDALDEVFRRTTPERRFCAIGSVKSNIGHAEAASGLTQLAKVVLQMEHAQLVPSIKTSPPNAHVLFDDSAFSLQRELADWPRPWIAADVAGARTAATEYPRRALVNSFGAGESNACIVVEEYVAPPAPPEAESAGDEPQVLIVSARTMERLHVAVSVLAAHLREHAWPLADIAFTLQGGREAMAARFAVVVRSRDEAVREMERFVEVAATAHREAGWIHRWHVGEIDDEAAEPHGTRADERDAIVHTLMAARDLDALAALWVQGAEVVWPSLQMSSPPRIVPLPTYPFERQRCWLDAPAVTQAVGTGRFTPPRTDLERTIVEVWEEVLGVTGIGIRDSFLDIGGSSLAAGRIALRLREAFGVEIPAAAFVGARPTVESHAIALVTELARREDDGALAQHLEAVARY